MDNAPLMGRSRQESEAVRSAHAEEDEPTTKSRTMRKQRRKFAAGVKQQIVSEVESSLLLVNAASYKSWISGSVIHHRR